MIRLAATGLTLVAFTAAPAAAADPQDLVPGCGGQVAVPGECAPAPDLVGAEAILLTPGAFPGANPNIPPGPLPLNFPVVLPLGVTPFNIPPNLPLGPTPPTRFPFQ